jgi:hypothetical protein
MNRSFSFARFAATIVFGALIAVVPVSYAMADLDDLLGAWADAAAAGSSNTTTSDEVSLTPASATESLASQTNAGDQLVSSDWTSETNHSAANHSEATQSDDRSLSSRLAAGNETNGEEPSQTLTGSATQEQYEVGHSVAHDPIPTDLYHVATPTENPYATVPQSDCGCDSPSCDGASCGGSCRTVGCAGRGLGCGCTSCGELLTQGDIYCLRGQSECRPHRRPNLPPPSTFLDLFRSRNSYTDVWAGYAEETRLRVRNRSPHLDGTWKCRGCGALVESHNHACGCGCDR